MTKRIAFFLLFLMPFLLPAQDFLLQGWYWDYPGTGDGYLWADTLALRAADLAEAGFTYLWLPPLSRASSGNNSNGYDPKDLFDLGDAAAGATRFGTRANLDDLIDSLDSHGIKAVADVVYNHRDGGSPENNAAVEGWIENYNATKHNSGDNAYPSDRFRCIIPIGGATGYGTGNYYFKIRSASQHSDYHGKPYKFYIWTNTVGWQALDDTSEVEPNGGGDSDEPNNMVTLGRNWTATIDASSPGIDEFHLNLTASDFDSGGDTLFVVLSNINGDYSDHYIYGLWYDGTGSDIQGSVIYQTYTDFTGLPSGRGDMTHLNFKPNGNPTQLDGAWDWPWFFYDYDQSVQSTVDTLFAWTRWLWNGPGMRGFRMDAVKHFDYAFVGDLLDDLHDNGIDPGLVVGEFYDNSNATLKGWVDNVKANMDADTKAAIQPRVFDFSLRQALKDACDSFGYDVRNIFTSGLVDGSGASGFDAVTFTGNHDFRDEGQYIENDPILAYAYILTNNQVGLPCVFYLDYINGGLKSEIDALMDVHQQYIHGATGRDYLSRSGTPYAQNILSGFASTTLIYQLMGTPSGRDMVVAVNFAGGTDTLKIDQGLNLTDVSVGDCFMDVLANSSYSHATVDGSGQMYIELPPRSYSIWAQSITLSLNVLLEGPYLNAPDEPEMSTALNSGGYLPLTSPYSDARTVDSIPEDVVDWVEIELRATADGEAVTRCSALLKSDGTVVDIDGTSTSIPLDAAAGAYFVVVNHRNHLAVMSASTVNFSGGSGTYDFTSGLSQYYGGDAVLLEAGIYGLYTGDANENEQVQPSDKNDYWWPQTGLAGYRSADFNLNGEVQPNDKNDFWWKNAGKGSQVP